MVEAPDLAGLSRSERIAALRAHMQSFDSAVPAPPEYVSGGGPDSIETLDQLGKLLPGGGFPRKSVTGMANCPALVAEVIAHATSRGLHVGVVGWPELLLAHVAESGDLSKVIVVPDPGVDPWAITAVLAEGLDMVIHHGSPVTLSPARARPVLAKIRGGHAAVLSVDARLPGTDVAVDAEVVTYRGIGAGTGRIRGVDIEVAVRAKGAARPAMATITCGQQRRLRSV